MIFTIGRSVYNEVFSLPLACGPGSIDSEHIGEQSDLCLRAVTCWQPPESGCSRWHRLERAGWPVPSVGAGIAPAACPDCPLRKKESHHVTSCSCFCFLAASVIEFLRFCLFLFTTFWPKIAMSSIKSHAYVQSKWQWWIHYYHPSICLWRHKQLPCGCSTHLARWFWSEMPRCWLSLWWVRSWFPSETRWSWAFLQLRPALGTFLCPTR